MYCCTRLYKTVQVCKVHCVISMGLLVHKTHWTSSCTEQQTTNMAIFWVIRLWNTSKRQSSILIVVLSKAGRGLDQNMLHTHLNSLQPTLGQSLYSRVVYHQPALSFSRSVFQCFSEEARGPHPESHPGDTWDSSCYLSCSSFCDIRSISLYVYMYIYITSMWHFLSLFKIHVYLHNHQISAASVWDNQLLWWWSIHAHIYLH